MIRTRFILISLLLGTFLAQAQTIEVSGVQAGTWQADTIKVVGNVRVLDSLCIAPGTTVLFDGYYQIAVGSNARLSAIGTESDSIWFTVADTTGFHYFNFGRGGWNGIRLDGADGCRFDYCRFQYGKAALDTDQDGGALRIFGCNDVEIGHSTLFCNFSREHGGALSAIASKVVVSDCDVLNNLTYTKLDTVYGMYGGGMRFLRCEVDITATNFRYNIGESAVGGALSLDSCALHLDRCKFEHNYGINGAGLYLIRSNDWDCSISNSLFANNTSGHFGGGLAISDSSPLVSNLTVVGNHSIGVNCGGIFFYQHSSPEMWNCIVYGNTNEVPLEEPVQMWSWTYDDFAPEFHNCLVQFGFDHISNNETIHVYENCIDADPLFANMEAEDYHLTAGSPCIDAGSPETPEVILSGLDLDGNERVKGSRIDMGAYEFSAEGVQETAQNEQNLCVVGNPITSESYAEIKLDKTCELTVMLVSIDGKLLTQNNLGRCQVGLNRIEIGQMFQPLSKGSYVLVVQGGGKTFTAKVVR